MPITEKQWISRAVAALIKSGYNSTPSLAIYAGEIMKGCDSAAMTPEAAVQQEMDNLE